MTKSVIGQTTKVVLSCALSASLVVPVPVSAYATELAGEQTQLTAQAVSASKDINALWAKQANGTAAQLTLTSGGTYYLTGNLTTSALLAVDAPGKNVTIKLQGHKFTCTEQSMGAALRITAAKSVTVEGAGGSIVYQGGVVPCGIKNESCALHLRNLTVKASTNDKHTNLNRHNGYGVCVTSGTLDMQGCSVSVDMSNQSDALDDGSKSLKESPSGVYIGADSGACRIANSTVKAIASPLVERCAEADDTAGYAYGLRVLTEKKVTVAGGSVSATCALGDAVAISGSKLELANYKNKGVKLTAKGGARSVGVESFAKKGVLLNSKLSMATSKAYAPSVEAALYSTTQNAFVLGSKFSGKGLGIYAGEGKLANTEGIVALSFAKSVRLSKTQLKGMFSNARTDVSSVVSKKGATLVFSTASTHAKARIGKTSYSSVASAIAHVKSGQTIKLLASCGAIDVSSTLGSKARFTLDLAGKAASSINVSTEAAVTIKDSSNGKATVSADSAPALTVAGPGSVTVNGVKLATHSASTAVDAVSVTGSAKVSLSNASVAAHSTKNTATAINVTAGDAEVSALDTSIIASGEGASNAAYGIKTSMQSDSITLAGCTAKVSTTGGNAAGFEGKGTLSLKSSAASVTKINVHTASVATAAYGVNMTSVANVTSTVELDSASVSVTAGADATTGEYWTLSSGSGDPTGNVSWRFAGTNTLVSANDTHISQRTEPLVFAAGAGFSSGVTVNSTRLSSCVVARAQNAGADISAAVARLVPYAKGEFADWGLAATGTDGAYRWQLGERLRNERTGAAYQTLADALSQAAAGDTIALTADCSTTQLAELGEDVTLDLAGHRLVFEAGKAAAAGAAGSNAAIVYKGAGNVTLTDSARSGALDIHVGGDTETETTGTTTYQGIAITGGGTLNLDGCAVNLTYTGASKAAAELGLRGIGVVRGAVKLAGGASLNVTSVPVEAGCTAPVHATGIYATQAAALANGANSVEVDSSSSVNVTNQAAAVERSSLHYSESSSIGDLGISSGCLTRVNLDRGSERYQEIAAKFLATAKLDSSIEGSSTFDSQIYYSAPMELADGTYIWAYSAPVDAVNLGEAAYIVPDLIFEQSTYQVAAEATGIAASATFGGNVNIQGRVNATSTGSAAYAIDALGKGTWIVNSSALGASGASGSYALATKTLDLRDYFDLSGQNSVVSYPSTAGSAQKIIEQVQGTSQSISSASTATLVSTSGSQITPPAAAQNGEVTPSDGKATQVNVTFGNLRGVSGELEASARVTVPYGSELGEQSIPAQPDYTADGATYRFVGWQLPGGEVVDPKCAAQVVVDDNITGAVKGSVTLSAFYVRVENGEHLATFKIGRRLLAYAVADGKRPSYGAANAGDAGKIPVHESVTGYLYTFKGWHADWSEDEVWQSGDGSISTKLPAATGDVTYTARFKVAPTLQSVYFSSYRSGANGYVYAANPAVEVSTGDDPTPYANKIAEVGSVVDTGDGTYVLLGWSTRKTDKQPLYTTSLPAVGSGRWGDKISYYAIYALISQTYNVTFVVNGQTVGTAAGVKASSSISAAFKAAGIEEPAAAEGWEFDGWAVSEGGSALRASMVTVAQACAQAGGTGEVLTLYAVFANSYNPEVCFKTPDGADIRSTTVKYGQSAQEAGVIPTPARKLGSYFVGWVGYDGSAQDMMAPITNDIDYYASYAALAVDKPASSKVKVNLARAGLIKDEMTGAASAGFGIAGADAAADSVRKRVAKDKARVIDSYTMSFGYEKDGEHVAVGSGFGTITMELPVKTGANVKIYWLRSNGSVGVTATKVGEKGYVSFALADLGEGDGNLVVATSTGSSAASLAPPARPSASMRPHIAVKSAATKPALKKKAGAKKASTKVTAAELAANDAASQGQDALETQETQGQESNPAMFYVVLAAIVAFAAFLVRRMYLFIGKRKEEDLDESLDETVDEIEESIRF